MGERSQGSPREAQHYLNARAPRESPSGASPRGPHFAIPAAPGPATSDNRAPGRPIPETGEVDALLSPAQGTHDSRGGIVNPTADAENPWAITPFELHELADAAGEQTVSHQGTPEVELDVRIELGRPWCPRLTCSSSAEARSFRWASSLTNGSISWSTTGLWRAVRSLCSTTNFAYAWWN